jgi:nucleotide-binding universal stress UspA family protein
MIPRFKHILVPVDFTPKNAAAVDITLEMAVQYDARVSLLHVIERINLPDDEDLTSFYAKCEERTRSEMASMARRFDEPQIPTDQDVQFGNRVEEIVRFSVTRDVDLIVMSSHKVDPTKAMRSWSTVSYHVSLLCSCPVLLVK